MSEREWLLKEANGVCHCNIGSVRPCRTCKAFAELQFMDSREGKELTRELEVGREAAETLCAHLKRMGAEQMSERVEIDAAWELVKDFGGRLYEEIISKYDSDGRQTDE